MGRRHGASHPHSQEQKLAGPVPPVFELSPMYSYVFNSRFFSRYIVNGIFGIVEATCQCGFEVFL